MEKKGVNRKGDLKDFIIKEIEHSGFTLEQHAINLLAKRGWTVYPGFHFHDKDANCDRELDIFAEKDRYIEEQKLLLTAYLVVQCKKIPGNTWVFFPGPVSKLISGFTHSQKILTLLDAFDLEYEYTYGMIIDKLGAAGFCSSSYTEIITDLGLTNKKTNNLFEAITSVLKAISAPEADFLGSESVCEKLEYLKPGKVLEWIDDNSPMNLAIILPIIVFDGNMFTARFPLNKNNLKETCLVNYYGEYKSGNYYIGADIDIVNKSILSKYLNVIDKNFEAIVETATRDVSPIRREISEKITMKLKVDSKK